jgi:hypothetical protein
MLFLLLFLQIVSDHRPKTKEGSLHSNKKDVRNAKEDRAEIRLVARGPRVLRTRTRGTEGEGRKAAKDVGLGLRELAKLHL